MKSIFNTLLLAGIILFAIGCKDEDKTTPTAPTETMIKIGETYINGAKAKAVVYSYKALETGYNDLYVSLLDSVDGTPLAEGHLSINPMMDMGMMKHSTPIENPKSTMATNGYFKVPVVFIMAGTASQWALNISFHNHKNNLEGEGSLGVAVIANTPSKMLSSVLPLDSNAKVFISMVLPSEPKQGINDFEITLHKKIGNLDFPAIEDYTVEIEPEMPSMGHGSPNNVNPVHTAKGHYAGKVNFTMTGLWHIKLKLYKNGVLLSNDLFFEITLK
jgi:hypothetical protein